MPDEILTLPDVAEYLKVGEQTVYRMAREGVLPAFKVRGSWRFHRARIDLWIEAETQRQATAGQPSAAVVPDLPKEAVTVKPDGQADPVPEVGLSPEQT